MSDYTGNTASECRWCSEYHAPQWACEQDGLRREIERLTRDLTECRRLLREAVEWLGDVRTNDEEVETWLEAARKAAGGE